MIILLWYTYFSVYFSIMQKIHWACAYLVFYIWYLYISWWCISKSEIFDCIIVNDAGFLTDHVVLTVAQGITWPGDVIFWIIIRVTCSYNHSLDTSLTKKGWRHWACNNSFSTAPNTCFVRILTCKNLYRRKRCKTTKIYCDHLETHRNTSSVKQLHK
jgi:hypothetical protein